MKAFTYKKYGPPEVLKFEEIEKPVPGNNEVLIKIHAASVNPLDYHLMRGKPNAVRLLFGLLKPKFTRFGRDVAGVVETVGRDVTEFKPGDAVFGTCRGAFAEYVCTTESSLVLKPVNITFEQAAAVPVAAFTALQGVRDKGLIRPGQKILINGAGGGVGSFALQIAKSFGTNVTGVCSTGNMEKVRSMGADRVIDYTKEDFTKREERFDLIFDCYANHSLSEYRRILNPGGRCVQAGGPVDSIIGILAGSVSALFFSKIFSQTFLSFMANVNKKDLTIINELLASGKIVPLISRRFKLEDVPEAVLFLEEGHPGGKVVIKIS